MKKPNNLQFSTISEKRFRKDEKRNNKNRYFTGKKSVFDKIQKIRAIIDSELIDRYHNSLIDFLTSKDFFQETQPEKYFVIGNDFTLENNFEYVLRTTREIISAVYAHNDEVIIDFSNTVKIDYPALFLFKTLMFEIKGIKDSLSSQLQVLQLETNFKILKSQKSEKVNNLLIVADGIPFEKSDDEESLKPYSSIYLTGKRRQRNYNENKKGVHTTKISNYISEQCLKQHNFELSDEGRNKFDGMISEILNNAEDHGTFNKWYIGASFLKESNIDSLKAVGEVNICFLNFGDSIFQAFQATRGENFKAYSDLQELLTYHKSLREGKKFTEENLITLYSLQEGISRLKFERESRGTGTINFINSFFEIGDYEDTVKDYKPKMQIISGHTSLKCDKKYQPYQENGVSSLSLNPQKSLEYLPDPTYLKHQTGDFPGTMLFIKVYLNEQHLTNKQHDNGKGKD